jgi:hypothetical protein
MGEGNDPASVWDLIRRADDLLKYAPNRDRATAYQQARGQLEKAAAAAQGVADTNAREGLARQVRTRLQDLDRLEA